MMALALKKKKEEEDREKQSPVSVKTEVTSPSELGQHASLEIPSGETKELMSVGEESIKERPKYELWASTGPIRMVKNKSGFHFTCGPESYLKLFN